VDVDALRDATVVAVIGLLSTGVIKIDSGGAGFSAWSVLQLQLV
jgi:uncharacterized ferredoxin-like protein